MHQAEFWRQREQDFLRYSSEETEKLVVRWESALRANIDETESAAIITEQGGQENHRERSRDGSSFGNQFA
jgi:hypothetical protein